MLNASKPLWAQPCAGALLAFAIREGAGASGWPRAPAGGQMGQSCKATLGTPEDTAPCHHPPAPTWQGTLARDKPGVVCPKNPVVVSPGLTAESPLSPGLSGVPLLPILPPAQFQQPSGTSGSVGTGGSGHSPQGTVEQGTCDKLLRPWSSTSQSQVTWAWTGPSPACSIPREQGRRVHRDGAPTESSVLAEV